MAEYDANSAQDITPYHPQGHKHIPKAELLKHNPASLSPQQKVKALRRAEKEHKSEISQAFYAALTAEDMVEICQLMKRQAKGGDFRSQAYLIDKVTTLSKEEVEGGSDKPSPLQINVFPDDIRVTKGVEGGDLQRRNEPD